MPSSSYRRKKDPVHVRRALLDAAERIAVERGVTGITIQAVADAAGVTKGGLLHHFTSKEALLAAVFADMLAMLDSEIDALMAADPEPHGRFTRAYLAVMLSDEALGATSPRAVLSVTTLGDRSLDPVWRGWLEARLARHQETDGTPELEIARFAGDGAWLAYIDAVELPDLAALRARLMQMTRAPAGR